jgi:hypothetical protein
VDHRTKFSSASNFPVVRRRLVNADDPAPGSRRWPGRIRSVTEHLRVGRRDVRITHADRVVFREVGLTKLDLAWH